jgi:transglutaminase-like putative cysteine protease
MPSQLPGSSDSSAEYTYLRVRHETSYHYPGQASLAYNKAWLAPLARLEQQVLDHHLRINPRPQFQRSQIDSFGNRLQYFEVHNPHSQLQVISDTLVARKAKSLDEHCQKPWETIRYSTIKDRQMQVQYCPFAYPSPMAPFAKEVQEYTLHSFSSERPAAEALLDFACRIHKDFEYDPLATQVDTTLHEFCEVRKGVCQDFSHFAVSGLRSIGLVAAYISGYVLTYPPEGQEKRPGSDASHAWVALLVPEYGWLHVDPTNNMWVANEHIILALGRDYSDVPPLKGVCYGAGQQQPEVAVSMHKINKEELPYGY